MRSLKYVIGHFAEIAIAVFLLYVDIRYFLLYWFIYWIFKEYILFEHERKMMRCLSFATECKIIAIMNKLQITPEDLAAVTETERKRMGEAKWRDLEKEWDDIS